MLIAVVFVVVVMVTTGVALVSLMDGSDEEKKASQSYTESNDKKDTKDEKRSHELIKSQEELKEEPGLSTGSPSNSDKSLPFKKRRLNIDHYTEGVDCKRALIEIPLTLPVSEENIACSVANVRSPTDTESKAICKGEDVEVVCSIRGPICTPSVQGINYYGNPIPKISGIGKNLQVNIKPAMFVRSGFPRGSVNSCSVVKVRSDVPVQSASCYVNPILKVYDAGQNLQVNINPAMFVRSGFPKSSSINSCSVVQSKNDFPYVQNLNYYGHPHDYGVSQGLQVNINPIVSSMGSFAKYRRQHNRTRGVSSSHVNSHKKYFERTNISSNLESGISLANKQGVFINSASPFKVEDSLRNQYLKQDSTTNISNSSCMYFNQNPNIVGVSCNESYDLLCESKLMSRDSNREWYFANDKRSTSRREATVRFCRQLNEFRRMHLTYCIRLMNRIFRVRNGKLVMDESIRSLFSKFTLHSDVLFFIIKGCFIVNLSSLYGWKDLVDDMWYCSMCFGDQSFLDLLVSEIVISISNSIVSYNDGEELMKILENYFKCLPQNPVYEPYSAKFFEQVFDICRDFAPVKLSKEYQELVDFVILACSIYSGNMITMLYKMLAYKYKPETSGREVSLVSYLKAERFCNKCHDIIKTMAYMYYPSSETEQPSYIGGIMKVPLMLWRRCSREIHDVVRECIRRNEMDFSVLVNDIVSPVKCLVLIHKTRSFYLENIEMYERNLKTMQSPSLSSVRVMCANTQSMVSKVL